MSSPQEPHQPDPSTPGAGQPAVPPPPLAPPTVPAEPQAAYDAGTPGAQAPHDAGQLPQPPYGAGQPQFGAGQPHDGAGQPQYGAGQPQGGPSQPQFGAGQPHDGAGQPQYGGAPHNAYATPNAQNPYAQAPETPFGLPGGPPAKSRKKLWIILSAVGAVLALVLVGVLVLVNIVGDATSQAKSQADDFTKLVIAGESSKAYDDFLDPALQKQISKESFVEGVASLDMDDTCKQSYNSVNVANENDSKSADFAGVITCDGKTIDLGYRFEGTDQLKITEIKLRPAS